MNGWRAWRSGILIATLGASACAVNPVTGDADFVLMSAAQERELGGRYHEQIVARYGLYPNPQLQGLVARVGQRLALVSHRPELAFRFTLLDSPEVNAFALPGGYVYITRGLLAYLGSEAELAAVLGHEIGHVTARHAVRRHSASTVTGLLAAIIGAQAGGGGQELVNLAGTALVRGYGREHELESDRLGAEYLARAGYDPQAMLEVIRVLKDQELHELRQAQAKGRETRVYHGLLATHPDNDRRLQEVVAAAQPLRRSAARRSDPTAFLQALDGLLFGDSEAQGVVRAQRFYHRELGITLALPAGWQIHNGRERLVAVAPARDAVVQLELLPMAADRPAAELLRARLAGKPLSHEFVIEGEGRSGHGATVRLESPFGVRDARVAVVIVAGKVFQLSAVVDPSPWPPNHAAAVRETLFSLRPLQPDEHALAAARRLQVVRLETPKTVATLASKIKDMSDAVEQLRLLNRLYPEGEPRTGQWFKLIR